MGAIYCLIEYGASLFDAIAAVIFLTVLFSRNKKISKPLFGMGALVFAGGLAFLQDIFENSMVTLICLLTAAFLFSVVFLGGKWKTKLIYVLLFYSIQMITDMIIIYGITAFFHVDFDIITRIGSSLRILTLIIHKILFLFTLISVILLHQRIQFSLQQWVVGGLMYLGALLNGCVIVNITNTGNLSKSEEAELVYVTLGLLAICIAVSICLYYLNRQQRYQLENRVLAMKLQEEKETLEKMNEMAENIRILRHDLKHYLTMAQGILRTEGAEKTELYLEELLQSRFEGEQIYHTDSTVINTVLNNKSAVCRKNGISCEIEISGCIGEEQQIDLGIILSNLMDNAIEAELGEDNRRIRVEMTRHKGNLFLQVKNSISSSVLKHNPTLQTVKQDKTDHGKGIKSVKKLVEKMEGTFVLTEEEDSFLVTIVIPENANRAL